MILCVRNGASVIRNQLNALDQQVPGTSFEVIIVENGSTDETTDVVTAWRDEKAHPAQRVIVVDASARAGISFARNRGIEAATGEIVAFCDADDEVDPGWVNAIGAGVPVDGIAGGRVLARTADGTPDPGVFPDALINHGYLPFASGCNMAGRRSIVEALGGYDESLPPYGYDDVDFSWRAQQAGHPLAYIPDAVVHMTLSSNRQSVRKRFLLGKGRILMASRYPGYDSRPYSFGFCTGEVLRAASAVAVRGARATGPDRVRLGRDLVDSTGRWWGYLSYRGSNRQRPHTGV